MSVHTFETMGTVVSVRVPDNETTTSERARELDAAIAAATAEFESLNKRFSLYREDSEISRIARGELTLPEASDEMRSAYAESLDWREKTNYTFTPHRPDGVLDLSGTIKAVGIQRAANALVSAGFTTFLINAGGDLLSAGHPVEGWRVGVTDPDNAESLIATVELSPEFCAMATSGSAERGEHIWLRPETDNAFRQVSVAAGDIMTADVLATTIIAGGQDALDTMTEKFNMGVLVVKRDGSLLGNNRFQGLMK